MSRQSKAKKRQKKAVLDRPLTHREKDIISGKTQSLFEPKLMTIGEINPHVYQHFGEGFFLKKRGSRLCYFTNLNYLDNPIDQAIIKSCDWGNQCIIVEMMSEDGLFMLLCDKSENIKLRITVPSDLTNEDLANKEILKSIIPVI